VEGLHLSSILSLRCREMVGEKKEKWAIPFPEKSKKKFF